MGEDESGLEEASSERIVVRRAMDKEPILDASLALSSEGIKHWIEFDGNQYILSLEPGEVAQAHSILTQYETENEGFQNVDAAEVTPLELHLSPLLHLSIPVAVFFWIGATPWGSWLTQRGGADAQRILAGEWWRCLTATTLHVDHEHFLSNMISGFFILNLLRRRIGPGTSMLLLTLAAGFTNFLVAYVSDKNHFSIGFSTVVFAALGMLAGMETLHLPRNPLRGLRSLSPLLAAFFLAVLVGIGEKVDIKAHFFGFGFGALLSPLASRIEKRWASPPRQIFGALTVYAVYVACWMLAQR